MEVATIISRSSKQTPTVVWSDDGKHPIGLFVPVDESSEAAALVGQLTAQLSTHATKARPTAGPTTGSITGSTTGNIITERKASPALSPPGKTQSATPGSIFNADIGKSKKRTRPLPKRRYITNQSAKTQHAVVTATSTSVGVKAEKPVLELHCLGSGLGAIVDLDLALC
jgi:hypothetical protein